MKNDDFEELMKELQTVDIQLPLHKKALRDHIIEVQAQRAMGKPRSIIAIGARAVRFRRLPTSRKILSVGAVIIVAGILLAGMFILLPMTNQAPAKELIAEAAEKVDKIVPQKGLTDRLDDAKHSTDAYIAPAAEVRQVLAADNQEQPKAEVYVAYTAPNEQTVVIGLNTENEPLFAVEVGNADHILAKAAREAEKEARQAAKELAKQEKELLKTAKALEKSAQKGANALFD